MEIKGDCDVKHGLYIYDDIDNYAFGKQFHNF